MKNGHPTVAHYIPYIHDGNEAKNSSMFYVTQSSCRSEQMSSNLLTMLSLTIVSMVPFTLEVSEWAFSRNVQFRGTGT